MCALPYLRAPHNEIIIIFHGKVSEKLFPQRFSRIPGNHARLRLLTMRNAGMQFFLRIFKVLTKGFHGKVDVLAMGSPF